MAFTGRLGSSDSSLGNIVLGLGAAQGRRLRRNPKAPHYRIQVLDFADNTNFGIGDLIVEFDRPHAIGYADYFNSVPEAFFSLHQDDPKITALRGKGGKAHVAIWRGDDLVWIGWVSLERDANSNDAIFYCYGYLAGLFWSLTEWKREWTAETVATIVTNSWARATTAVTKSRLGFVDKGTIEAPTTTAGGSTAITLPVYEAYYKRILYLMQEMAAIGGSDTGNSTAFEITTSLNPQFNFWKDRKRVLTDVNWTYGDSRVASFREYGMPVYHRNAVKAVGQQPRDVLLRKEVEDTTDMDTWGRMEEPLFLAWVKDETELDRVTKQRAEWAKREDIGIQLDFKIGAEPPPYSSDARFRLGDVIPVKIDRGVTNIDKNQQVTGYMVAVLDGQEKMSVLVQDPVS